METRYNIVIAKNPNAGEDMIDILIIDTKDTNGHDKVLNKTVHKTEKISTLHPYMEQFGHEISCVDISK